MPHTKRKGKLITSTPVISLNQPSIQDLFGRSNILSPEGGVVGVEVQEQGLDTLTHEISLSPGAPSTPDPPTRREGGELKFDDSQILSLNILPPDEQGVLSNLNHSPIASGSQFLKNQKEDLNTVVISKEKGTEGVRGEEMAGIPVVTFKKFSLEEIGNMIISMQKSISDLATMVQEGLSVNKTLQTKVEKVENSVNSLSIKTEEMEKIQLNLIKSEKIHIEKLEQIENQIRRSNLRVLNFPITHLLSPRELFKSYLINILKYTEITLPVISRIYYVTQAKSNYGLGKQNQDEVKEDINLSELLEKSSDTEIKSRATLVVQFADISQRDIILRLYFKHQSLNFHGYPIRIFPDVSLNTQLRRKEFLVLREQVTQRGAKFILRFPCRCIVLYQNNRYIFNQVDQL